MILAPSPYKYKKEVEKTDDKGNVVRNAAGEKALSISALRSSGVFFLYAIIYSPFYIISI